jgi:hypothetical protein
MYKLGKIHVIIDALTRLPNIVEPTSVHDQTIDAIFFYIKHEWLKDVKEFLGIR